MLRSGCPSLICAPSPPHRRPARPALWTENPKGCAQDASACLMSQQISDLPAMRNLPSSTVHNVQTLQRFKRQRSVYGLRADPGRPRAGFRSSLRPAELPVARAARDVFSCSSRIRNLTYSGWNASKIGQTQAASCPRVTTTGLPCSISKRLPVFDGNRATAFGHHQRQIIVR